MTQMGYISQFFNRLVFVGVRKQAQIFLFSSASVSGTSTSGKRSEGPGLHLDNRPSDLNF